MTNCTATFLFPPYVPFTGCAPNTSGVVMSLSPNIYWDLSTDTNGHIFTNTMGFPLQVGDVICVNGFGDVVTVASCTIKSQFLIDGVPITNPFPACPGGQLSPNLAQYLADTYKIDPSVTITLTDTVSNRQVVITTNDGVHLIATLVVTINDTPIVIVDIPFTCTTPRRRRSRRSALPVVCLVEKDGRVVCNYIYIGKDKNGNNLYKQI